MNNDLILQLQDKFNSISNIISDSDIEFWYARDLQDILGYERWDKFKNVIEKAKVACDNSEVEIDDHFRHVGKMVPLGSGAIREVEDIMLTRYACYLIAQSSDSSKEQVAFAQTYFAIQTRKQELFAQSQELKDRMEARTKLRKSETELSQNIYERGVDDQGFARIRSKGDKALFGGNNTQDMKDRLHVPKGRTLADFLPTVTITAKNLATEITNHNVKQNNLQGESAITQEHIQNNSSVRDILIERGIEPEKLPPAEDIKKLERKVNSEHKKLIKESSLPKSPKNVKKKL